MDTDTSYDSEGSQGQKNESERKEKVLKILIIGDVSVGKTSFIKRYVHKFFSQHYRATIGVDFALKDINWKDDTLIRLQLWDIAGQERFETMSRVYFKEASGAFVVADVSNIKSFDSALRWKKDLDNKVKLADGSSVPCVLLANKSDLEKEGIANDDILLNKFCEDNSFSSWFYTSAKENLNIEKAAHFLVEQILERTKQAETKVTLPEDSKPVETVILTEENREDPPSAAKKCC